jgi:hypothetical protein
MHKKQNVNAKNDRIFAKAIDNVFFWCIINFVIPMKPLGFLKD